MIKNTYASRRRRRRGIIRKWCPNKAQAVGKMMVPQAMNALNSVDNMIGKDNCCSRYEKLGSSIKARHRAGEKTNSSCNRMAVDCITVLALTSTASPDHCAESDHDKPPSPYSSATRILVDSSVNVTAADADNFGRMPMKEIPKAFSIALYWNPEMEGRLCFWRTSSDKFMEGGDKYIKASEGSLRPKWRVILPLSGPERNSFRERETVRAGGTKW